MATLEDLDSIKGWFYISDRELIPWILERQRAQGVKGDVVELGCYLGKSAVVIGQHVAPDETFTVLDLFEGPSQDQANGVEQQNSYSTLTRLQFEANYLRFHPALPVVVQDLSSAISQHVAPGSVRFMHVDASHLYAHVRRDVESAQALLQPDGVVVFDDYRSEHTPGVSAAVWEAVVRDGLVPFVVTPSKLYATWGDPGPWISAIEEWAGSESPRVWMEHQSVLGHDLIRLKVRAAADPPSGGHGNQPAPTPSHVRSAASPSRAASVGGPTPTGETHGSGQGGDRVRAALKEVTPPVIARRLHRLRMRRARARAGR